MADDKGLINLCGLWVQTAKDSRRKYMSGRLGVGGKLMIFRNAKKKKDTDPDYYAVLGEWKQAEGDTRTSREQADDEVPF